LVRDTTGILDLHEEVIWAWEATRAEAICAAAASTLEATAMWERYEASIKEAEAWASLAEREA
jgi:hypothetical protein